MRIAVVTGSGRGIGNAIASTLEREGVTVVYSTKVTANPGRLS